MELVLNLQPVYCGPYYVCNMQRHGPVLYAFNKCNYLFGEKMYSGLSALALPRGVLTCPHSSYCARSRVAYDTTNRPQLAQRPNFRLASAYPDVWLQNGGS
jgi:hypothetical protein